MEAKTNIANNSILEALSLSSTSTETLDNQDEIFSCIFCEFNVPAKNEIIEDKTILQHLFMQHRLVIADVNDVADLKEYLLFWKNEFKG